MTVTTAPLRPAPIERTPVDLAEHRQLLADLATLEEQKKQIEAMEQQLRGELKKLIGEGGVGMLDGRPIYTYGPTDKLAEGRLKKDYPDFYDHYCKAQVKQVLDVEKLKAELPELYAAYQVRALMPAGGRRVFVEVEKEAA
jgi:hypothetical protein